MLTQAQQIAAKVTDKTRRRMLLNKVPRTRIAAESGVTRQTVAKYIEKSNDMPLSVFIAAQTLSGNDPLQELADAIRQTEQEAH